MADARSAPLQAPPSKSEGEWLALEDVLNRIEAADDAVVALSLTGGGASGAYQAGVITALLDAIARRRREHGRCAAVPQIVVGTSAGALNAFALLLEWVRPAHFAAPAEPAEPLVSSIWRTIGANNQGASFVTGRRSRLVAWVTRWRKWKRLQRIVTVAGVGAALALANPVLFAVIVRERSGFRWIAPHVLARPVTATLIAAVLLVAIAFILLRAFGRALFGNEALRSTLAGAAQACLAGRRPQSEDMVRGIGADEQQRTAIDVVRAWSGVDGAPDLVVTATDLTARWECLFALASAQRCATLAKAGWEVARVGGGAGAAPPGTESHLATVHESELFRCIVASTSIPGVFPSQRIRLHRLDGSRREHVHDFVDGGVLNNSPMNVAVDAGATHVISIELDPLVAPAPLDARAPDRGEPSLVENVAHTFATVLEMATTEDVIRTVAVNRMLARGSVPALRVVEVYRIAPSQRALKTLDFNGHYDHPLSTPSPTLVEWMEQGALDARESGKPFWRATQSATPG